MKKSDEKNTHPSVASPLVVAATVAASATVVVVASPITASFLSFDAHPPIVTINFFLFFLFKVIKVEQL